MKKPAVPSRRTKQRGIALAYFGIMLLMFVSFAVIGIDVGRLAFTASEVQSMADAAALGAIGAHGAGVADPTTQTRTLVGENTIDARAGNISNSTTAGIKTLTPGIYDFATKSFTASAWTDPTVNAARALGSGTVTNFLAAAIGVLDSTVERQATAAIGGACNEEGALPIAIEQDAIQAFLNSADCRNIPVTRLFQVPKDNSCFTSLSTASAGSSTERGHVPNTCCKNNTCGGGETESLNIGDPISVNNGQDATVLQVIAGCLTLNPPLNEFVVPVIADGGCSGPGTKNVVSFARIIIDHVQTTGAATLKGVYIKGVCREEVSGSEPGCKTAGENAIALVQ